MRKICGHCRKYIVLLRFKGCFHGVCWWFWEKTTNISNQQYFGQLCELFNPVEFYHLSLLKHVDRSHENGIIFFDNMVLSLDRNMHTRSHDFVIYWLLSSFGHGLNDESKWFRFHFHFHWQSTWGQLDSSSNVTQIQMDQLQIDMLISVIKYTYTIILFKLDQMVNSHENWNDGLVYFHLYWR